MKNKAAQSLGRLGGKKTAKRGKDYYSLIGKKGAEKRWAKAKGMLLACGHSSMTLVSTYKHPDTFYKCMICGADAGKVW